MARKKGGDAPWQAPDSVLIAESRWRVECVPMDSESEFGATLPYEGILRVNAAVAPELRGEVFLHELLHAVWAATGLSEGYSAEQEEQVVRALSPMLYATLRRNGLAFG